MNNSSDFLEIIREEIQFIVKKEIEKYMKDNRLETPYDGKVTAIYKDSSGNVTTADVDIKFQELKGIKNKTGEVLRKNDCVTIYARGGNINNSYIGLKF